MSEWLNNTNTSPDNSPVQPEAAPAPSRREMIVAAMDSLRVVVGTGKEAETYYEAADPGYKSSFTRDSMIAMMLRGDSVELRGQIDYSVRRMGSKYDPVTGEEPGKAHHELPAVVPENGLSTAYNACDSTAELLRGIAALAEMGDTNVLDTYVPIVARGVAYIQNHVNKDGLFVEDPFFSAAIETPGHPRRYALNVTYWKDSELNSAEHREPKYPIVYSLAHFQNANALWRIGRVLGDERLVRYGRYMTEAGVHYLWSDDHFRTAIDNDGFVVDGPSDDSLMALLYIPPSQLPSGYAQKIQTYMQRLETPAGYRAGIPVAPDIDPYHMGIWTHAQALEHAAARLHGLDEAVEVTSRITSFIDPDRGFYPEVLDPDDFSLAGNPRQLWAMGAALYFDDPDRAHIN